MSGRAEAFLNDCWLLLEMRRTKTESRGLSFLWQGIAPLKLQSEPRLGYGPKLMLSASCIEKRNSNRSLGYLVCLRFVGSVALLA